MSSTAQPYDAAQDREALMTETEVADMTRIAVATLRTHRCRRRGIPHVKIGSCVRYKRGDVLDFIEAGRVDFSDGKAVARGQ